MVACMWLKVDGGVPHRGAFAKPRDWYDDGSAVPDSAFRDRRGARVLRRVPALGYEGDDIRRMHPIRGVRRYVDFLVEGGQVLPIVQTNAAAHVPSEDTSYQRDRHLKARHFGWIEWPNKCPVAMLTVGEIRIEQLTARGNKGPALTADDRAAEKAAADAWRGLALANPSWWGTACPYGHTGADRGPCIHAIAERAERRRIRAEETKDREERHKSEESKAAREQTAAFGRLAESQAALTAQLAATLTAPKETKK